MLVPEDILAVVVSYNGLRTIVPTVRALQGQVGRVYVVDNGSDAPSRAILEELASEAGLEVTWLERNRGVGHALNLGVERARRLGFQWLLTMDQDSVVDASMMRAYQAEVERDPRIVCLAPTISGRRPNGETEAKRVRYAITSGNLVRLRVFEEIGLYDEGFFIDCIDFDFSLRVRRAGHRIMQVAAAVMQHQLGDSFEAPAWVRRIYSRHRPVRRYYMYRNYLYLAERNFLRFPLFIFKLGILKITTAMLVAFFDAQPARSYRAIARGVGDYIARRRGEGPANV